VAVATIRYPPRNPAVAPAAQAAPVSHRSYCGIGAPPPR
jgi:hypothetical protein